MATRISKRTVDALRPGGERYDVFDRDLRGFSVRVHPTGLKTYRFKYVAAGRQRVATIGEHGAPWAPETVRAEAEVLRGMVRSGRDPRAEAQAAAAARRGSERRSLTVAQLIERWLSDGRAATPEKRASSWRHDASRLRRHVEGRAAIGIERPEWPLTSVTRAQSSGGQGLALSGQSAKR